MKKFAPLPLFLIVHLLGLGQTTSFQADMPLSKPIPPNAAALFKVLERPLGSYTGTVPINIPLCQLTNGSLSASLALNYTGTGGIRVAELPGCVGLGWSLADGAGRITQQVRGRPDDQLGMLNSPYSERASTFNCADTNQRNDYSYGLLDLEPDQYLFNFNGRSGRFFLKEDGSVVIQGNEGIKIAYSSPGSMIRRWIITDENGNKYYFGTDRDSTVSYIVENKTYYTSLFNNTSQTAADATTSSKTWYLTEARDLNEEHVIKYTYALTGNVFTSLSGGLLPINPGGMECTGFNIKYDEGVATTDASEYVVSRIDAGSGGYATFNLSPENPYGSDVLFAIQLYDSAGHYKKQYKFNYGTFARGDWKLNSFSEFGSSGADSLTYSFTYMEQTSLPNPISNSVDFWGFYNGAATNSNVYPAFKYVVQSGVYWRNTLSSNRYPDGISSIANVLTKISYPTGGSRTFQYEGNTALYNDGFSAYSPDPGFTPTRTKTVSTFNYRNASTPAMQDTLTVNSADGWSTISFNLSGIFSCGTTYSVKLYQTTTPGTLIGGNQVGGAFTGLSAGSWNVSNGYYRIDVFVTTGAPCIIAGCTASWDESILSTATVATPYGTFYRNIRKVGGVRIKEIDDYDPLTGLTNSTLYKYQLYSADSTLPSGQLVSPIIVFGSQNNQTTGCNYVKLYPGPSYPFAAEQGSYVVYPEVRTIQPGNGRVDRTFSYVADAANGFFPETPLTDYSANRGHLTSERTYSESGALLHATASVFSIIYGPSQSGVRVKVYWQNNYQTATYYWTEFRPPAGSGLDLRPHYAICNNYNLTGQAALLVSSSDTTYSPNGKYVVAKRYQYKNYKGYYPIGSETITISGGQSKQKSYNYSFDTVTSFVFGLSAAEQTMKPVLLGSNYLQPLEITDSLKPSTGAGNLLDGVKYSFGYFNGSRIHLSGLRKFGSLTDSVMMNYTAYDSTGNLTEQYKTGDPHTITLWGYGYTVPIARVTGSTYSTVLGFVNNVVLQNPSSDQALRTELAKIRTGLVGTKALVFTYTYLPLVGMTSQTDPAGTTTFFEFDPHGRLNLVRDAQNNIIKKYTYNLINPQ